jgi:Zn-dependent protease
MNLDPNTLITAAVQILILLLAISAHEAAHGWVALRCGDRTAFEAGRVTLNPVRHLDLFGSLLVPGILALSGGPVFGWARPTPVRISRLRRPSRDHVLVLLAGPGANVLLALLALAGLAGTLLVLGGDAGDTASAALMRDFETAARGPAFPLVFTLVQAAFLNGFLAVFNLLPIPPLDGGQLTLQLLPTEWAIRYSAVGRYGFIIVLGLAVLNLLWVLVVPVLVVIAAVIALST